MNMQDIFHCFAAWNGCQKERKKCVRKIKSSFVSVRLLPLSWFAPEIIKAWFQPGYLVTWFQPQLTKVIPQASIYFFKTNLNCLRGGNFENSQSRIQPLVRHFDTRVRGSSKKAAVGMAQC